MRSVATAPAVPLAAPDRTAPSMALVVLAFGLVYVVWGSTYLGIAVAIQARDLGAIGWAILGMGVGILLYDQLFFRPLLAWADKFRFEGASSDNAPQSWLLTWLRRTQLLQTFGAWPGRWITASFAP